VKKVVKLVNITLLTDFDLRAKNAQAWQVGTTSAKILSSNMDGGQISAVHADLGTVANC
jgi:hypothetical protein